jgi:hypothetical protein
MEAFAIVVWSLAFVLFLVALALMCPLCRRDVKDWSTCCNKCVTSLLRLVFVSHLVTSDEGTLHYGEFSCGGKGGTGDWRTCSPLGAWWFEPAEKCYTKETRLQVLDMIRQETRNSLVSYSPEYRGLAVSETPVEGGGVIGAKSPGRRVIPPDVARYLVSSSNLLVIACCDRKYSCCWSCSCATSWSTSCWHRARSFASCWHAVYTKMFEFWHVALD